MYIDLVLCVHSENGRPFLFSAPAWSYLKSGDEVIVEARAGLAKATVIDCRTVENDSDELMFCVECAGATLPLKRVMRKVTYREFTYPEEAKDEHLAD